MNNNNNETWTPETARTRTKELSEALLAAYRAYEAFIFDTPNEKEIRNAVAEAMEDFTMKFRVERAQFSARVMEKAYTEMAAEEKKEKPKFGFHVREEDAETAA